MTTKFFKSLFCAAVLLFALGVGNAWASNTYYATAGAKSTGNGYVYVEATSTLPSDAAITTEGEKAVKGRASSKGNSADITFAFGAKPVPEKVFLGWKTEQSASAPYTGEAAKFTITVSSNNTTDPTVAFSSAGTKRYAYFGDGVISPSTNLFAFNKTSGTFTVTYVSGNAITITSSNSKFTVSPSSIAAGSGTQTVTVTYTGSTSGIDRTLITLKSDGLESQYVDVSAVEPITSANAATFRFETGTVNSSTSHPCHPIESLGVSECFAGSSPAFDELYLFGKTLQRTNHAATSININNAVTPCYVYTKSGSTYVFSKVVNMNSDTKGIGVNVAANGQKLYFSGWCPYASTGKTSSDNGVFHISGATNKTVDIYLSNAYIYSRTKFNGLTTELERKQSYPFEVALSLTHLNDFVTGGSGGVFVLQTTSTTSTQPFKPNIHLRNSNFLQSNQGNYVHVVATAAGYEAFNDYANQCSSPIHMLISSNSQYETLTIDDIWPTASGTMRTNGAIQLDKAVNQAPSIDLGNGNSVVNLNGGRITLANAIPGSTSYTTSFAISCRKFVKEKIVTATLVGIGGDLAAGTINFNDGTFDVKPLSDADFTKYNTLYHDKKSVKCAATASINGGTYNCSIWKCADPAEIGASPTDKSGTSLCKLSLLTTGTKEHGFAEYTIPAAFKPGLDAYYAEKGWTYGENSIAADAEDYVHLMLPCDLIDESAIISVENIPWVGILPEFQAGAIGLTVDMGGDKTITSDETHVTNRLLYGRIDDYVANSLSGYTDPKYGSSVTLKSSDKNKNALNTSSYTISNNSYILLPLVADQWFAFAAPFDVKKVSIIDAYPDALATAQSNAAALTSQAHSNLDLFCYIANAIDEESLFDIEPTVNSWINCEKTERYPDESAEIKNQFKKREILPYTSAGAVVTKNNFWLYENNATWAYDGKNFTGQTMITGKTDGILMAKNKVYSLMFPSEGIATGDWKYWTGKYILLEGGENCEIAGKNSQPATNESFTSTTTAAIKGNHTLADIPAPASVGAFWGYDYSTGTYKHQTSKTNPTQAFIYTSATPNDETPAVLTAIRANGVCLYNITYSASTLLTLAAPEYGTYYVEGVPTTKYFYNSGAWKKLIYDGEKNLYLCAEDSHYYRYDESASLWVRADFTITWKNADNSTLRTDNNVLYGTTPSYGSVPTQTATAEYTYTFASWTPAIVPATADAIYTATYNSTPRSYTLTWVTDGDALTGSYTSGSVAYGTAIVAPNTPTKAGFTFDGWTPDVATNMPAANTTYTATWIKNIPDRELDIVDWTDNSIKINVSSLKTAAGKYDWKIYVNGTDYTRTSPQCDTKSRTMTISGLSLTPNDNLLIQLKDGTGTVESQHNYKIPQIYTANATLSGTTAESVVYVYGGKLTISGNAALAALYVCPGAEVEVTGGTLTVGKLVLRTKPWATAAISGSISASNIYYTRIAPDGSDSYPTGKYYQFGLPYECAISDVRLSDGTKPAYNTTWILKKYNEETRATNGADGANWDAIASTGAIEAGVGYEMLSATNYYREYYFPVTPTDNTSVIVTRHEEDEANSGWNEANSGWNIVCSPLMSVYQNTSDPVTGIKVSWLQEDGSYDQQWPETIWPAMPFSYQASANGSLDFSTSNFRFGAPRRRNVYTDSKETEWIHIDIQDMKGKGDHTSLFVHPDRFEATYETGIDVAKQSLSASRAIIYSSHAYGEMAFAGVADSLLEAGVALTVYSPKSQELTFSLRDNEWLNRMESVWLIDKEEGMRIDLLNGYYTFNASEGTTRGRFFIQGQFKAPNITTELEPTSDSSLNGREIRKVIINQKMFIEVNGRLYDATGKEVKR